MQEANRQGIPVALSCAPMAGSTAPITMAANLPLSILGMFVFVDLVAWPVAIAAPVVTVLLAAFNFIAGRWALHAQSRRQT